MAVKRVASAAERDMLLVTIGGEYVRSGEEEVAVYIGEGMG